MRPTIDLDATDTERRDQYEAVMEGIQAMLVDEPDWTAAMATVACELHHAFGYYDWTGFYRHAADRELIVGPYQGTHGCLRIDFERGICGAAARERQTQLVEDVETRPDHIACSTSTRSEVVVPVEAPDGRLLAVLDVDSDTEAAFDAVDRQALEALCVWLGRRYGTSVRTG